MKKFLSTVMSAAMVASLALPVAVGTASVAEAKGHKYCKKVAHAYANKKTKKKIVVNTLLGVGVGAAVGNVFGGKKTTIAGAALGGTAGAISGDSKWEKYYWARYEQCRDE